jgi:hypothetical protein
MFGEIGRQPGGFEGELGSTLRIQGKQLPQVSGTDDLGVLP